MYRERISPRSKSVGSGLRATSLLAAILLLAATGARAQNQLDWELLVGGDSDDNVNYADGEFRKAEDDTVARVIPSFDWEYLLEEHRFGAGFKGDFREGQDTELSQQNLSGHAEMALEFSGGLGFDLYDRYSNNEFDQRIFAPDAGVTQTESNVLGTAVSYQPRERLLFTVGYEGKDEDFGTDVGSRELDRFEGRVEVPVGDILVAYGLGRARQARSNDRPETEFDSYRWAGGLRWEGPSERFRVWLELGYQQIDFNATDGTDYDDVAGQVGASFAFTETTSLLASVGRDGYGNPEANLIFLYDRPEELEIRLLGSRGTREQFVISDLGLIYESSVVQLSLTKYFLDRFRTGLEGNYVLFDTDVRTDRSRTLAVFFEYAWRDWLRLGTRYRYAAKSSDDPRAEFEINRIGVYVALGGEH